MVSNLNSNVATAEAAGSGGSKGGNQGMKKGPWTATEDAILIDYVKRHGEGNWNSVQKNSGLMRCGKSCRLRWANHLRPNLRKGSFTPEEERIIVELHAKLGNKWARMASQLPGRTDNEIKNYWNTRMKRRQRAGLPIYPKELQEEAAVFQFQQQEQQKQPDPSSHSLSSLLSSSQKAPYDPSLPLLNPLNFSSPLDPLQNQLTNSFYPNSSGQFRFLGDKNTGNNGGLTIPISPLSPYSGSASSTSLFNPNHEAQPITVTPLLHHSSAEDYENMSFTSLIMGAPLEPVGFIPGLKSELPSDQTLPPRPISPVSCGSGGVCVLEASCNNNGNENYSDAALETGGCRNSGLLDALLQEAKTLSCKGKSTGENSTSASDKGKAVMDEPTEEEEGNKEEPPSKRVKLSLENGSMAIGENQGDDLSSSQSSIVVKPSEEPVEEMHCMDDDLLSLLNNFPSSEPLPEWYYRSRNGSHHHHHHGLSSGGNGDVSGLDEEEDGKLNQATTAGAPQNLEWVLGSGCWNNMPGIC